MTKTIINNVRIAVIIIICERNIVFCSLKYSLLRKIYMIDDIVQTVMIAILQKVGDEKKKSCFATEVAELQKFPAR